MIFVEIPMKSLSDEKEKLEKKLGSLPLGKSFVRTRLIAQLKVIEWVMGKGSKPSDG